MDRRTDRTTNKHDEAVRNFENAPKKGFVRSHNIFFVNITNNNEINSSPNMEFGVHYKDHSRNFHRSVSKCLLNLTLVGGAAGLLLSTDF